MISSYFITVIRFLAVYAIFMLVTNYYSLHLDYNFLHDKYQKLFAEYKRVLNENNRFHKKFKFMREIKNERVFKGLETDDINYILSNGE